MELDGEVSKEAGTIFKELNLTQDQGQRLVDFYTKQTKEAFEAPFKVWEDKQKEWAEAIQKDPEIGGKLDQVKTSVAKAINGLDQKLAADFRSALNYTGAGNNPAVIKALYAWAQKLTEGGPIRPGGPVEVRANGAVSRPSIAAAMFPTLPSSRG